MAQRAMHLLKLARVCGVTSSLEGRDTSLCASASQSAILVGAAASPPAAGHCSLGTLLGMGVHPAVLCLKLPRVLASACRCMLAALSSASPEPAVSRPVEPAKESRWWSVARVDANDTWRFVLRLAWSLSWLAT